MLKQIYHQKISGKGNLNFILIHNAGGDNNMFLSQIAMLLSFGNVILLDLPGHGKSSTIKINNMDSFSNIIIDICNEYILKNIWLIGLNNGANIAINAYLLNTVNISGLILIDPILFMDDKFIIEIEHFITILRGSSDIYKQFIRNMVSKLLPDAIQEEKSIPINAFNIVDKSTLQELFLSLIQWDRNAHNILPKIQIPTLCITTDNHHCQLNIVSKYAPQFYLETISNSTCWPTLARPMILNVMIKK